MGFRATRACRRLPVKFMLASTRNTEENRHWAHQGWLVEMVVVCVTIKVETVVLRCSGPSSCFATAMPQWRRRRTSWNSASRSLMSLTWCGPSSQRTRLQSGWRNIGTWCRNWRQVQWDLCNSKCYHLSFFLALLSIASGCLFPWRLILATWSLSKQVPSSTWASVPSTP